jgi:hypothetical protein
MTPVSGNGRERSGPANRISRTTLSVEARPFDGVGWPCRGLRLTAGKSALGLSAGVRGARNENVGALIHNA